MTANGNKIAEGRLERTVPVQFSLGEGLDIGMDSGSAVDFTYKLPFKFTGTIEKVEIDLAPTTVRPERRTTMKPARPTPGFRQGRGTGVLSVEDNDYPPLFRFDRQARPSSWGIAAGCRGTAASSSNRPEEPRNPAQ